MGQRRESCVAAEAVLWLRDRLHLQVAVNYSVFMEVLHCCQHLVDHDARVFLGVNPSLQDPVKQLSARHPVTVVVQKEKARKLNKGSCAFTSEAS